MNLSLKIHSILDTVSFFLKRSFNMQTYFYVGNCDCTFPLTPEIALAVLIEKDYAENIYGVYENYGDACAAAKILSARKGKACPIIAIGVDKKSEYVCIKEYALNIEQIPLKGKKCTLYTSQLQAFHLSPPAMIIKHASLKHDAINEPEISFQYEKLNMDKVNIELDKLRRERREALHVRVIQNLYQIKCETTIAPPAPQNNEVEDPNLALKPPDPNSSQITEPALSEQDSLSKRRKMGC
jgi:hypothetical protein